LLPRGFARCRLCEATHEGLSRRSNRHSVPHTSPNMMCEQLSVQISNKLLRVSMQAPSGPLPSHSSRMLSACKLCTPDHSSL